MDSFLKMDIFFGVATAATIILTMLVAFALMYLIQILRTLDHITKEVKEEAQALRKDLDEARKETKRKTSAYLAFFEKAAKRLMSRPKKRSS